MAKKSRRRKRPELYPTEPDALTEETMTNALIEVSESGGAPAVNEVPEPRSAWLSQLRADVVNEQNRTAHTIAELEAWAAELASTIAFLRARK